MASNIIACRTSSYGEFEPLALEHIASIGLKHVEIMVPPPDEVAGRLRELAKYGLRASSMHGECDVTRADIAERVAAQMPAFDAFGCKLMFVSVKAGDVPLPTAYARLREAGDMAAEHGVTIALETHPDLATSGEVAKQTMLAVDHPNVRVNYDTANIYFYNEGTDGVEQLRTVADFVAAMHLKDTNGAYRTWHFPALGEGAVDFPATFKLLDERGYTGPYTLEIEGIEGEPRTEELVCGRIAASVEYLRKLGRL